MAETENKTPKEFLNIKIKVPSIEEQVKIASFLRVVDKKVDLIQKQINLIDTFKKAMFQQLFV